MAAKPNPHALMHLLHSSLCVKHAWVSVIVVLSNTLHFVKTAGQKNVASRQSQGCTCCGAAGRPDRLLPAFEPCAPVVTSAVLFYELLL